MAAVPGAEDLDVAIHEPRKAAKRARYAAEAAGEDTFAYGLMHQRQACQATKNEQAVPHFAARAVD